MDINSHAQLIWRRRQREHGDDGVALVDFLFCTNFRSHIPRLTSLFFRTQRMWIYCRGISSPKHSFRFWRSASRPNNPFTSMRENCNFFRSFFFFRNCDCIATHWRCIRTMIVSFNVLIEFKGSSNTSGFYDGSFSCFGVLCSFSLISIADSIVVCFFTRRWNVDCHNPIHNW